MASLDNIENINKLDKENMLGSIQDFPDQIENCWEDWKKIAVPTSFVNAKNILILGIGGSGQGGLMASLIAMYQAPIPIMVHFDYDIPSWVDKNTLVIAVSYSGETEETLESLRQAAKKTEKIITISTGGTLYSLGSRSKALHYRIRYGSQPRAALGYNLTTLLAILKKLNFIDLTDDDIKEAVLFARAMKKKIDADVHAGRNAAKRLAERIHGRIPIILGSGQFYGVAKRWKAQMNENAKNAAYFENIPEQNHFSLVGIAKPDWQKQNLFFIILQSKFDHKRNVLRQEIVSQLIKDKRIPCEVIGFEPSGSQLSELIQAIYYGDYVSYYLAILNDVEPNPVEIIGVLKKKLAEKPF